MEQLTITIEGKSNVDLIIRLMRKFNFVKSITRGASTSSVTVKSSEQTKVEEPAEEYNWINPSRPATDEEFEQMISEAENEIAMGLGIPAEEARKQTLEKIKKWKTKK